MNIIFNKNTGDVIDFIDGTGSGLNPLYMSLPYTGDKTETNISEIEGLFDSITHLYSLDILRAMKQLPSSTGDADKTAKDDLDALFDAYPEFKEEWLIAPNNQINLKDASVIAALEHIQVDVDAIKKIILGDSYG